MNEEIVNGKIIATGLGFEDHGIFTCILSIQTRIYTYSFGGYALDGFDHTRGVRVDETGIGTEYIKNVLDTVGESEWEKLKGQFVRIKVVDGKVAALGNILEEKWFEPGAWIEARLPKQTTEVKKKTKKKKS
jgi:hypothetical protein